jgi:ABC-2 type transport system permease protein
MLRQIIKFSVKDFAIQKKSILSYMIVGMILISTFTILNITDKQMIFAITAFSIIYGFVNKALYEDEKNNTLRLIVSLPIKREIIVYARYLSTGLVMVLTTVVLLGISSLIPASQMSQSSSLTGIMCIMIILVFIIMLSIYLPLAFKLGYIKAANINRFIFVAIFAFFGAIAAALGGLFKGKAPENITNLDNFLSSLDLNTILTIAIASVLIIYLVSMRVSISLFRKRNVF